MNPYIEYLNLILIIRHKGFKIRHWDEICKKIYAED